MDYKEVITLLSLLVQAFEDGKISGAEVKQILNVLIPDDFEFSFSDVMALLKHLGGKL